MEEIQIIKDCAAQPAHFAKLLILYAENKSGVVPGHLISTK